MKKRIFISFAVEDTKLRDFMIGQSHNSRVPFEFIDMSVKKPWDNSWKTNCRSKIKGCHGMIVLITSNTKKASGELWEINCAQEENIPTLFIWGNKIHLNSYIPITVPPYKVRPWTWETIETWVNNL